MKREEITDELFNDFLNNNLSVEQMKEVESALIANGEVDAIVHAIVGNYEAQKEYADELLGEDDEMEISPIPVRITHSLGHEIDEKLVAEKNKSKNCKINDQSDSIKEKGKKD